MTPTRPDMPQPDMPQPVRVRAVPARTEHLVAASDGCPLAVTLIAAPDAGPSPTVLLRTPYGRHNLLGEARGWAARGFVCAVGDVRGRFGSGGRFRPYRSEAADGVATLDWLATRPDCDGRVVLAGASYGAHCAVVTAVAAPDAVCGVLAAVPALGAGETAREPGGAARLACRVGWWSEHGDTPEPRAPLDPPHELLRGLPVLGMPAAASGFTPTGWAQLWATPERDAHLWRALPRLRVPLLAIGGHDDPFAAHTLALAQTWGGPVRMLLGPWGHDLDAHRPGAALAGARIGAVYARWAHAVCGDDPPRGRRSLIAVDDMGGWRRLDPDADPGTSVGLHVEHSAFTADPDDPFPSRIRGHDLAPDDTRTDRALLRSAPLQHGELRGPAEIVLTVRSDTPDADWIVRLSVPEGGTRRELTRTVLRRPHIPGRATTITLRTPPFGTTVAAGARLLVEVAGHHWPAHARNPHTGTDPVTATTLLPSRRAVLGGTATLGWSEPGHDAVPAHLVPQEIAT